MRRCGWPLSFSRAIVAALPLGAAVQIGAAVSLGAALLVACGARPMPPGYAGDDVRTFVAKHRAELQAEIVTGSGPRIYDLAIIANCQDVPGLSRALHRHHDDFFLPEGSAPPGSNADPEVAERVLRFMSDRRDFRCLDLDLSRSNQMSAGRRHIGPRRGPATARGGTP